MLVSQIKVEKYFGSVAIVKAYTSKTASLAIPLSAGIDGNVIDCSVLESALEDEWILSYHSMGMNSMRSGMGGIGSLIILKAVGLEGLEDK